MYLFDSVIIVIDESLDLLFKLDENVDLITRSRCCSTIFILRSLPLHVLVFEDTIECS